MDNLDELEEVRADWMAEWEAKLYMFSIYQNECIIISSTHFITILLVGNTTWRLLVGGL